MIATMDQLTLVGRKRIAHDLLSALQSLGVVQIDPLETSHESMAKFALSDEQRSQKEGWDAAVSKSQALIEVLGVSAALPGHRSDVPVNVAEVNNQLASIASQVERLVSERADYRDELDVISNYLPIFRDVTPATSQLDNSRYLQAVSFIAPADRLGDIENNLSETLENRFELSMRPRGKEVLMTAVVMKKDREALRSVLSRSGLSELALPDRYHALGTAKAVHTMEERSQSLPKRLGVIEDELRKLGAQYGGKLNAIYQVALNHQARFDKMMDMAQTRYGLALRGWVPSDERNKVMDSLKKQFGEDIIIEAREADAHHDEAIPVKLENPAWVRPFQGLLALFAPPKYGNFDPSWTLAVFFPLYFGIVVGDIGFGLCFLALGLWLRHRGKNGKALGLGPLGITLQPAALPSIGTVIIWCAVWSMVWGFLYGEFFGNFLEKWYGFGGKPLFYTTMHHETGYGWINIPLFRVENFAPLLMISLGFGVFQVLFGWFLRAYYGYKHHDRKHLWEGIGMMAGLTAIVIFAWSFLTGNGGAFVNVIVIAGFAVFLLGVVLSGVPLMLVEIISNSGAILSYLRLFAVGLSAALVANLATDLGFAIGKTLPIIGPILGILVALAVHFIAIALTIIGHTLQPLRLQYVEFFSRFGFYEENGRPYQPFKLFGGKA